MNTVFAYAGQVPRELVAGARGACPATNSLPCLYSHNSDKKEPEWNVLAGSHKQTAYVLVTEIQWLAKDFGIERLGFLTLTFGDHVTGIREAQRRFNNLNRRVIRERFERAIVVWERQRSRRIHFHLVVVLPVDIRTGFDFEGIERGVYSSANAAIRSEWAFWRRTAPKYRFGRTELLPVKSTADGIARYVGKYVSKCIGSRSEEDKGARVVRYIGYKPGERRACSNFAWNSNGSWLWRHKLKAFCEARGFADTDALQKQFGPRWAYKLQESILATVLPVGLCYPSKEAMERDTAGFKAGLLEDWLEHMKACAPRRAKASEVEPSDNDFKLPDGMRADGRRARFEVVKLYDSELGEMVTHFVPASMEREPW